jgi:Leucine-rich repeat (LRR) protein
MKTSEQRASDRIEVALREHACCLDLSGLGLKTLSVLPSELRGIVRLNLSRNRLKTIPDALFEATWLEVLDLGGNWLSELPAAIGRLDNLSRLDLSENQLTLIPPELFSCVELRDLSLYMNQITSLPAGSTPLHNLSRLDVSSNQLTSLRDVATAFPGLRDLDASGNALKTVDAELASMSSLRVLNLSGNHLISAASLAGMTWMRELYLDDNRLTELPGEIANFAKLQVFSAVGNPFGTLSAAFDRVSASQLRSQARSAFQARISVGDEGKENLIAPSMFFNFALALSGLASVLRFIDLYFKQARDTPKATAVMRFPDGSIIELSHLSRKATLDLVAQHERSLVSGKAMVHLEPMPVSQGDRALELLTKAVARVPMAEVTPKTTERTGVTLINGNLVQYINQEVKQMGDQINIDRTSGVVNVKSKLENVTQTIGASGVDDASKAQLIALMKQLSDALAKAPAAQKLDAEAISDAAEEVVAKATKPTPNKKSVEISGKGLLEAAKGIAEVVPIAIEIVKAVSHFVGIG